MLGYNSKSVENEHSFPSLAAEIVPFHAFKAAVFQGPNDRLSY